MYSAQKFPTRPDLKTAKQTFENVHSYAPLARRAEPFEIVNLRRTQDKYPLSARTKYLPPAGKKCHSKYVKRELYLNNLYFNPNGVENRMETMERRRAFVK